MWHQTQLQECYIIVTAQFTAAFKEHNWLSEWFLFEKIIEFYKARKLIILILTAEASISAYWIISFFLYIRPYYYNCMSYADKI